MKRKWLVEIKKTGERFEYVNSYTNSKSEEMIVGRMTNRSVTEFFEPHKDVFFYREAKREDVRLLRVHSNFERQIRKFFANIYSFFTKTK